MKRASQVFLKFSSDHEGNVTRVFSVDRVERPLTAEQYDQLADLRAKSPGEFWVDWIGDVMRASVPGHPFIDIPTPTP